MLLHQPDIYKICLYAKDPYEVKCQLLVNKQESLGLIHLNDSEALIEYSNDMDDIEEYNPKRKCQILIVFDDIIACMLCNKKLNPTVTEIFIR